MPGSSGEEEERPNKKVKKSSNPSSATPQKTLPNILVTGTPGTGKSTLCQKLCESHEGLTWLNVGDFAKEKGHLGDFDEEYGCHELEEDGLLDDLEDRVAAGGLVVDHHASDFFPERYFDIVFVLRVDNKTLHDRLTARGYEGKKLEDNVQCEIFQTVLDEARESYREEIVHELRSDAEGDIESNLSRINAWIESWKKDNDVTK